MGKALPMYVTRSHYGFASHIGLLLGYVIETRTQTKVTAGVNRLIIGIYIV